MSEDKTSREDGITTKNNLTRRDLALTSLAMGAAAVLPATGAQAASSSTDSGVSSSAEAGAAPNRSSWKRGGTIPAEYYLDEKWYARDELYLKENYWWGSLKPRRQNLPAGRLFLVAVRARRQHYHCAGRQRPRKRVP